MRLILRNQLLVHQYYLLDVEEKLGLLGGDIMHGVMTLDQMWAARPVFNYGDYKTPIKIFLYADQDLIRWRSDWTAR